MKARVAAIAADLTGGTNSGNLSLAINTLLGVKGMPLAS